MHFFSSLNFEVINLEIINFLQNKNFGFIKEGIILKNTFEANFLKSNKDINNYKTKYIYNCLSNKNLLSHYILLINREWGLISFFFSPLEKLFILIYNRDFSKNHLKLFNHKNIKYRKIPRFLYILKFSLV